MSVIRERRGAIEVVTLHRPEKRNALDPATIEHLGQAFAEVEADDNVRVLVLTGAGDRAFCAGMDLTSVGTERGQPGAGTQRYHEFLSTPFAKPVIAAVNGTAVAGGFELMLACDMAVAVEKAMFGIPEVKRGLIAGAGGTLLPLRMPMPFALELALTGELISATRALELGLINRIAPNPVDEAVRLAELIVANSPEAIRVTKRLMYETREMSTSDAWIRIRAALPAILASDDALEGARAFFEKRPPVWDAADFTITDGEEQTLMDNDAMYDDLTYDVDGAVATITINRPDRLNALRPHSLQEMARAIESADADRAVGVIVITGSGTKAFCAGGDLGAVADNDDQGDHSDLGKAEVLRWVMAFRQSTKPIIAKVRGYCIGLGNELNLLCDLTVAGESAQFGQAGPRVGSVPMVGGTQLLPLVCGFKRAKEILFLCRRYSGEAAVNMGLANVVVPDDDLDAEVARWTAELLEKSPQSLRMGKMSMSYLFDLQWPALQHGLELNGWMVRSNEMREGATAFMEKRKPQFRPAAAPRPTGDSA